MMVHPQLLTPGDIDQRFDLERYYTNYFMRYYLYFDLKPNLITRVIFFDGDLTIKGHMDTGWATAILKDSALDTVLILINGNLTVEGDIRLNDHQLLLLVMGNVYCDVLVNHYDYIHITGHVHIKYVFYGYDNRYYSRGCIEIDGTAYVPYVLTYNYNTPFNAEEAVFISLQYPDNKDVIKYDYTREVLADVIIPAAFNGEGNVDEDKFIEIVRSGKSPFIDGKNNRYNSQSGKTDQ